MKTFKYYIYTTLLATVFSCTYDFPEKEESTSGGADFTKYVSVGNSLTAGFMDGALYDRGQANSFTSILAGQMKLVGGGDFNQPDINSPAGFFRFAPDGQTPLGRLILQSPGGVCGPSPSPIIPGNLPQPFSGDLSQLNNFGVPGLTLGTALLPQTGGPANGNPYYNPYYARFASDPGTSTLIGDATMALTNGGTFFSFWLGNNDVLGYATGGASNPAIYTSTTDFETWFRTGLGALLSVPGTKGVVANIPNVTDIPYLTTINNGLITPAANGCAPGSAPSSALPFSLTAEQAAGLNMQYAAAGINPDFKEGKVNYFLITTPTGVRQMDPAKDFLILTTPTDSLGLGELKNCDCTTKGLRKGWGITKPIATNWVLDEAEVADITKRVEDFNGIIKTVVEEAANNERLALVDINKIFGEVANGTKVVNGINFTASIAPPFGAFSLDGVHPNARGSAFIANQFIDAINTEFGSSIPTVNPNNYPSNDLPQ